MLADRVKRYGSALKQVVAPMPSDASKIPQFLESIEAMFRTFEVPDDLHAKLLLPFLSTKAKAVVSRLHSPELASYEAVRDFILAEFKLTPREYKTRFDTAAKHADETFTLFAARLRNNLRYYLRSRDCFDNFDRLFALLIADKLKSCLPDAALNYVLSLEGNDCFGPGKIAELADLYVSNHGEKDKVKRTANPAQVSGSSGSRSPKTDRQPIVCFKCNKKGHIAKFCRSNVERSCFKCNSTQHLAKDCARLHQMLIHRETDDDGDIVQVSACFSGVEWSGCNDMLCCDPVTVVDGKQPDLLFSKGITGHNGEIDDDKTQLWEFGKYPQVETVRSKGKESDVSGVKLSSLKFMNVMFNDVQCVALVDSGAEIGVLSEALAEQLGVDTCGYISVRGIFSDPMRVPLINVTLKSCGEANCDNVGEGIQVVCAVAPLRDVTHDAVLPIDTVIELECLPVLNVMSLEVMSTEVDDCVLGRMACLMNEVEAVEDNENDDDCDNNVMNTDRLHTTVLDNDEMRRAQLGDDSSSACWEMAELGKGNFIIDD